jgi:hypothetical protein
LTAQLGALLTPAEAGLFRLQISQALPTRRSSAFSLSAASRSEVFQIACDPLQYLAHAGTLHWDALGVRLFRLGQLGLHDNLLSFS